MASGVAGVRASADADTAEQDLAWRTGILRSEVELRALVLMGTELCNYRAQVPGFTLPEPIRTAHRGFDNRLEASLTFYQ
jgi:hypothetical protein